MMCSPRALLDTQEKQGRSDLLVSLARPAKRGLPGHEVILVGREKSVSQVP